MKYSNITIIRLSSLGDIIHTLPAFSLLRREFPGAKISWIVEPAGSRLLENISGIDEIIVFNLKIHGLLNKVKAIHNLIFQFRNRSGLILDFQGLLKSAVLAYLLKGHALGFHKKNLRESLARFFYKEKADVFDEKHHVILKNIHLFRRLVGDTDLRPRQFSNLDYSLKPLSLSRNLGEFLTGNQLENKNFLILNVGGGWDTKILEIGQYIDIINRLGKRHKIVILWGNEKEREMARKISVKTGAPMSIFLDFSDLILFIKYSRLLITADTLALHIADMVNTPSVGIFGPTSPYRNGSILNESIAIYEKMPCNFCYKKKCGTMECIKKLNVNKIVESIEKIDEKCG